MQRIPIQHNDLSFLDDDIDNKANKDLNLMGDKNKIYK